MRWTKRLRALAERLRSGLVNDPTANAGGLQLGGTARGTGYRATCRPLRR